MKKIFFTSLLLFPIVLLSGPNSSPFEFVMLKQHEDGVLFFISGSYENAVKSILKIIYEEESIRVGDLNSFSDYEGFYTYGGVYKNNFGIFKMVSISELQIDKRYRGNEEKEGSVALKAVYLTNLSGDNSKLFDKIFRKYKGEILEDHRNLILDEAGFGRLLTFEKEYYRSASLKEIRE